MTLRGEMTRFTDIREERGGKKCVGVDPEALLRGYFTSDRDYYSTGSFKHPQNLKPTRTKTFLA